MSIGMTTLTTMTGRQCTGNSGKAQVSVTVGDTCTLTIVTYVYSGQVQVSVGVDEIYIA